jgi:hypothetical protein
MELRNFSPEKKKAYSKKYNLNMYNLYQWAGIAQSV